jgi:hypothetical protein
VGSEHLDVLLVTAAWTALVLRLTCTMCCLMSCAATSWGSEVPGLVDVLVVCALRPWVARGQLVPLVAVEAEAKVSAAVSAWEPVKVAFDTVVCAGLDCHPDGVILVEDDGLSPWIVSRLVRVEGAAVPGCCTGVSLPRLDLLLTIH